MLSKVDVIPSDYSERLDEILNTSWRLFQSQFLDERHEISKEASFQHHFARIIAAVGSLYCTSRKDEFFVDLETKVDSIKGKRKYVDITCEFRNGHECKVSCGIELKFKTKQQSAQDHGRIDAYVDIEAVELVTESRFTFGRFYMITNSRTYLHNSVKGVGSVFCLHDGHKIPSGKEIAYPTSKGREDVVVQFRNEYVLKWKHAKSDKDKTWYFLAVEVPRKTPQE